MKDLTTTITIAREKDDPSLPSVFELVKTDLQVLFPGTDLSLVLEDLEGRNQYGLSKYKVPLRPFDGNDSLREAYQEYLDFVVYLRQAIYEMDSTISDLLRRIYSSALLELTILRNLFTLRDLLD